jgi:hypothetical protein
MIVTEYYKTRDDGVRLIRTYSDEGKRIIQNETGILYDEAIDLENSGYTYSESEELIEGYTDPSAATEDDYKNALRDMGVKV